MDTFLALSAERQRLLCEQGQQRLGLAPAADHDLFDHCARHRQLFFKQSWVDYGTLHKGSLRLIPLPEQLDEWRRDYEAMRGEMFFDDPPGFDEILAVVKQFEETFNRH